MIFAPRKNIWTRGPKWQRGSVSMTVVANAAQQDGDIIDLQAMSASQEESGGAGAHCQVYNAGTREGEQWYDEGLTWTYQNDCIVPGSNANNYQMKWDALSGDAPTAASSADGVWYALSSGDFDVGWEVDGEGDSSGSVTVSIRKGTGSVLDTAVWDGEAIGTKKGQ